MLSRKLNTTLRRFIISVFLTLDIGLFVQAYLFGAGWCTFFTACRLRRQKQTEKKNKKRSAEDGEEVMDVSANVTKGRGTFGLNVPKMPSDGTQRRGELRSG